MLSMRIAHGVPLGRRAHRPYHGAAIGSGAPARGKGAVRHGIA